jgi:phosphoribosyl-AMP cyclohydrolase
LKLVGIDELDFSKQGGLLPVVVQDFATRRVLMLAYVNKKSLEETIKTGYATYWSRSRGRIWRKGETSGNVQKVREIKVDCDLDALLFIVEQIGEPCHLKEKTCFHNLLGESMGLCEHG